MAVPAARRSGSRRRRRRRLRVRVAALLTTLLLPSSALAWPTPVAALRGAHRADTASSASASSSASSSLSFAPPVDAEISDGWRPPTDPYGPGNRGWQYATAPGDVVSAAGDGTVTFAGPVGGSSAVTVVHVGGLRTTYSYLETVDVTEGQRLVRGQRVGTAGEAFHFGVLLDGEYVDPAVLFRAGALRLAARLLPLH